MNRKDYLETAKDVICKHRQTVHGNAENSFTAIALYWSQFLNSRHKTCMNITPAEVGIMMTLFKIARWQANPNHCDNVVDGIGYMALAGELQDGTDWVPERE